MKLRLANRPDSEWPIHVCAASQVVGGIQHLLALGFADAGRHYARDVGDGTMTAATTES